MGDEVISVANAQGIEVSLRQDVLNVFRLQHLKANLVFLTELK